MGQLACFDLKMLTEVYHLTRFVETGTGAGISLHAAAAFPFTSLWSCDIETAAIEDAKGKFVADGRIKLFTGSSVAMLATLSDLPVDDRILFWLDAHFPGAHAGRRGYGDEPNATLRWPLESELKVIKEKRPHNEDVLIIDDARLYLDGAFQSQIVPHLRDACIYPERGIDFITNIFEETHCIQVLYNDQGYICLSPTTKP